MILVVSHSADDHAIGVLEALERRGHPAVLVDTARFPSEATLTQRFGNGAMAHELSGNGHHIEFRDCHVAWWRRPLPFTLHAGIDPGVAGFTYTECHEAVAGLWAALDVVWVNPPGLDEAAHHKPYQLATATRVGLRTPLTLITNDPRAAQGFIDEVGAPERTVYKTFLASEQHWRETRVLHPDDLPLLDRVRLAPVIFQEYVPAVADIRATVVGSKIFATAIRPAPGGYELDYRMDLPGAKFQPTQLPIGIEERIHGFMDRLGLVYGAIDLRQRPDGEYVFLEVNPAGEWRFVEERTQQPITNEMADLLIELDRYDGIA